MLRSLVKHYRMHARRSLTRVILAIVLANSAISQSPDIAVGKKIFESQCALCHGQTGGGGRGPSLNRTKLNHAPDDEALRSIIEEGIPPEMPGAWQLHPHEVASVAAYVRSLGFVAPESLPGDPGRGALVYARNGCESCHMIGGAGAGFGPELTAVGSRRNGAHLRQTLLDPAASLPERFEYIAIALLNGPTVRGIRVNEDSFSIQIKDAGGPFHSFRKSEIHDLRRLADQTPMPSYKRLGPAELDDLVAYLASLKGKP